MKSYSFLFWGYLVVWLGIAWYLVVLGRRLTALSRRIEKLENRPRG